MKHPSYLGSSTDTNGSKQAWADGGAAARDLAAKDLGLSFLFPSRHTAVLDQSIRCLPLCAANEQDPEPGPVEDESWSQEMVVRGFSLEEGRQEEEDVLSLFRSLYRSVEVVDVQQPDRRALWQHLQLSMVPHHPNLLPRLVLLRASGRLYMVSAYYPYNVSSLMHFSSHELQASQVLGPAKVSRETLSDLRSRFLLYQLLHLLDHCHARGRHLGNITARSLLVVDTLWLYLAPSIPPPRQQQQHDQPPPDSCEAGGRNQAAAAERRSRGIPPVPGERTPLPLRWVRGQVSNLEYLLRLNEAAGRCMIDALFHPIVPWVSDLTVPYGGWRDLRRSKFRLNKGDAQLDMAFATSQHHITESLSELTYYIYMARRTPIRLLRAAVRPDFCPQHYPGNVSRMYEWTPDECIPAYFCDPSVFVSLHKGMSDMTFPPWCPTPSAFVDYHRALLESEQVSRELHHWIDLTFGYCLQGRAAEENKNVPLRLDSPHGQAVSKNPGFVQLFHLPHPRRQAGVGGRLPETAPQQPDEGGGGGLQGSVESCHAGLTELETAHAFAHDCVLEPCYALPLPAPAPAGQGSPPCSADKEEEQGQKADLLAAGCVLAELYLGRPVLSITDAHDPDGPGELLPLDSSSWLPWPVRSALHLLLQRDPSKRPSARDLLRLDHQQDRTDAAAAATSPAHAPRLPGCSGLFPPYFEDMHRFLSAFYHPPQQDGCCSSSTNDEDMAAVTWPAVSYILTWLPRLVRLPTPALALLLPYILQVLDDPGPFEEHERRRQAAAGGEGGAQEEAEAAAQQQQAYTKHCAVLELLPFLDTLGRRLGQRATQRLVLPRLSSLLDRLSCCSPRLIRALFFSADLWPMLIRRAGTAAFLAHLPRIMLRLVRPDMHPDVQQAAYVAIFKLGSPQALGPGLVARYLIPPLLERVGRREEPTTGGGGGSEGSAAAEPPACDDLYEARALMALCKEVDDDLVGSLMAEKVLHDTLPAVERRLHTQPSDAVCLSLLECFTVLDGFLCSLSPASITLHYLQAPPIPIQQLLHVLPLPPLPTSLQTTEPVGFLVPGSPRHLMHVQLCRLLASVCMRVDPLVVEELVLPVVNDFLEIYAHTYPQLAEQEEGAAAESRRAVLLMIEDLWVQLEGLIMADRNRPQLSANVLTRVLPWFKAQPGSSSSSLQPQPNKRQPPDREHDDTMHKGSGSGSSKPRGSKGLSDLAQRGLSGLAWITRRGRKPSLNKDASDVTTGSGGSPPSPHRRRRSYSEPSAMMHDASDDEAHALEREHSAGAVEVAPSFLRAVEGLSLFMGDEEAQEFAALAGSQLAPARRQHHAEGKEEDDTGGMELQELADLRPRLHSRTNTTPKTEAPPPRPKTPVGSPSPPPSTAPALGPSSSSLSPKKPIVSPGGLLAHLSSPGRRLLLRRTASSQQHQQHQEDEEESDVSGDEGGGEEAQGRPPGTYEDVLGSPPLLPWDGGGGSGDAWSAARQQQQSQPQQQPPPQGAREALFGQSDAARQGRRKRDTWLSSLSGGGDSATGREQVWLLGPCLDPPSLPPAKLGQSVGSPWPMRMVVQHSFQAGEAHHGQGPTVRATVSAIRSLAVDPSETLLLSGSRRGCVRLWSLRDHPVDDLCSMEAAAAGLPMAPGEGGSGVFHLSFFDCSERALALDGSLVVWDLATQTVLARRERGAAEIGGGGSCYVAAELLSSWGGGVAAGLCEPHGIASPQQILAATQRDVLHLDLRQADRQAATHHRLMMQLGRRSGWHTPLLHDAAPFGSSAIQCVSTHEDGLWVATGHANGLLCVLDRRTGEVQQAWLGHDAAVVKLLPWSRDKVMSVSVDRTAILWDLRTADPARKAVCALRGLPEPPPPTFPAPPSSSSSSTAAMLQQHHAACFLHDFRSRAGGKRQQHHQLLMAFAGSKGLIAGLPPAGVDDRVKAKSFTTPRGQKLGRQLNIQSAAILPLRQLLLLGGDDGHIRVCT